jgi:subtilisin family serine protease
MKRWKTLLILVTLLFLPISIQAQSNIVVDPLYQEQWPLSLLGFEKTGLAKIRTENQLVGKKIITMADEFFYQENQILNADVFQIELGQTTIRRLSVELINQEESWSVFIKDTSGRLIATNTSDYKRVDVLLPKSFKGEILEVSLIPEDGMWSKQPVIKRLTGTQSTIIAVVDSGVAEHEDFCDNILYSLGADFIEGMSLPIDTNGHGTHVAGIIAACPQNGLGMMGAIGGMAADIIPLKVVNSQGLTDDDAIALAVDRAVMLGADVINISIAGKGTTPVLEKSVRNALLKNIPVVAAAGNGNGATENTYPANLPGVITVAGVNHLGKKMPRSNSGWEVDVSAPGEEIISTYIGPSYYPLSGTSMATPFVTSIVAYYKNRNPQLNFIEIRRLLVDAAVDIAGKGYDIYTGAGLVQFPTSDNTVTKGETIEWLNLKNGQSIETKKSLVIGFSDELIGKQIFVFNNDRLYDYFDVSRIIEEFPIESKDFVKSDNSLLAVVVDRDNVVLADAKLAVANSAAITAGSQGTFNDVPADFWAFKEISAASQVGLVNGYPDGSFRPSESISRRQSMMLLDRLFGSRTPNSLKEPFKDITLSTPGVLAILNGVDQGYVKGSNGYFRPEDKLTRGQLALILARALKLVDSNGSSVVKESHTFKDVQQNAEYYGAVSALASTGIITKQTHYHPNQTITRAQFTTMLQRVKTNTPFNTLTR